MAGIDQTYGLQITDDAGRVVAVQDLVVNGEEELAFDVAVPGTSDVTVTMAVPVADVLAFYIVSDKAVAMQENVADLAESLTAGNPFYWHPGVGTNPFTVDIVSLKFTNAGSVAATVRGAFLVTV